MKKGKEYEFLSGRNFYIDENSNLRISLLVGSFEKLNKNPNLNKISCFEHYLNSFVYEQSIIKEIEEAGCKINENIEKIREKIHPSIENNHSNAEIPIDESKAFQNSARNDDELKIVNSEEVNDIDIESAEDININKIAEAEENPILDASNKESTSNLPAVESSLVQYEEKDTDDHNKILREVLPNLSDQDNNKKIEEIILLKNSEINFESDQKSEDFILPIEVSKNTIDINSSLSSPHHSLNQKNLNKMLEAAIPKKENFEKKIIEIISNRIKENGFSQEDEETPVITNLDSKSYEKPTNKQSDLLSSKRKRDFSEIEKNLEKEENSDKIKEQERQEQISEIKSASKLLKGNPQTNNKKLEINSTLESREKSKV